MHQRRNRARAVTISIHAPREGSDFGLEESRIEFWTFLSTLPARGATIFLFDLDGRDHISIHAPREGSDLPTAR